MAKEESAFKVIIVLVLIAAFAATLLAFINQVTSGPIAENKKAETKRAIKIVMNKTDGVGHPESPIEKEVSNNAGETFTANYFPVSDEQDQLLGYAIIVSAPNGFTNDFRMMIGVDTSAKVVDTYVLEHKETPGLGDAMTDEPFKKQFRGRTLEDTEWAVKNDNGDIDALTAATITSRAFTSGVKKALLTFEALEEEN